jgi:signal transduction histidine kinase
LRIWNLRDNEKSGIKTPLFPGQSMTSPLHPRRAIRILFIEDSEFDYELMVTALARDWSPVEAKRVQDAEGMRTALSNASWDAIISDHNLPTFSSLGALEILRASGNDLPFLVVSGQPGEDVAVDTLHAGADDYIMKSGLNRLGPALRRSLKAATARRERALAEAALRLSEARVRELAKHLEAAQEAERSAAASEIGEEIGIALTAVKFELAWLQRHTQLLQPAADRMSNAISLVEAAAQAAHRVAENLRPTILDEGIAPALEWLTLRFGRHSGADARFESNLEVELDAATSTAIYRACQDALSVVEKHGAVSRVDVSLFVSEDQIHLDVTDNGKAPTAVDDVASTLVIESMHERARNLHGSMDVSVNQGQGTTMLFSLPQAKWTPMATEV